MPRKTSKNALIKYSERAAKIYEQQEEEKRNAGRYTLQEAADLIEREIGECAKDLQETLVQAVSDDVLPVYKPGKKARYWPKIVREFYEEAYWNDLNIWLKEKHPRIKYSFPNPSTVVTKDKNTDQFDHDWITEAIKIANLVGNKKWAYGERQITARKICEPVATELGKNERYWGNRGPRDAHAIRNVALKGWKFKPPKGGTNGTSGTKE